MKEIDKILQEIIEQKIELHSLIIISHPQKHRNVTLKCLELLERLTNLLKEEIRNMETI